jgi:ribosomal protein S1
MESTQEVNQNLDLNEIKRKTHYTGKVVKIALAGAIIDVGLGIPGYVHISQLKEGPVNRVEDVIQEGQEVDVWVRRVIPTKNRIELTMIKPLQLEWREIQPDMVLKGKVTRLEKFGVFVDIGAERPGLVHISEMTHDFVKDPTEVVKEGDEVEVKVLAVDPKKKQIKLSMKALVEPPLKVAEKVLQAERSEKPEYSERPERGERRERRERGRGHEREDNRAAAAVLAEMSAQEEAVPTAMEMALREAMERSKKHEDAQGNTTRGKAKTKGPGAEIERILERTLQHKRK